MKLYDLLKTTQNEFRQVIIVKGEEPNNFADLSMYSPFGLNREQEDIIAINDDVWENYQDYETCFGIKNKYNDVQFFYFNTEMEQLVIILRTVEGYPTLSPQAVFGNDLSSAKEHGWDINE